MKIMFVFFIVINCFAEIETETIVFPESIPAIKDSSRSKLFRKQNYFDIGIGRSIVTFKGGVHPLGVGYDVKRDYSYFAEVKYGQRFNNEVYTLTVGLLNNNLEYAEWLVVPNPNIVDKIKDYNYLIVKAGKEYFFPIKSIYSLHLALDLGAAIMILENDAFIDNSFMLSPSTIFYRNNFGLFIEVPITLVQNAKNYLNSNLVEINFGIRYKFLPDK